MSRSLYDCLHAQTSPTHIYCQKGKMLGTANSGFIELIRLYRGNPLVQAICQKCEDFDEMDGGTVFPKNRGWLNLKEEK